MKISFFLLHLCSFVYVIVGLQAKAYENNSQIRFELGGSKSSYNNFSIPNSSVNKVSLPDKKDINSYRITGRKNLDNDTFLYFLYAPLQIEYKFNSSKTFKFNDINFNSDYDTTVKYKFNSYRLGYFKELSFGDNIKYWIGGVLKIRDAKIKVTQNGLSDSYSNIGVVPLLGLGIEYFINEKISLFSHIDALGSSKGSAYDFNAEMICHLNNKNSLGFGYRTLGGGVDNDKLMNFARFETLYISYSLKF